MIKKITVTLLAGLVLLFGSASLSAAYDPLCDQWQGTTCSGGPCKGAEGSAACQSDLKQQTSPTNTNPVAGPSGLLSKVTNFMAVLTGAVAVIMAVYAGLRMVLSSGNPEQVKQARSILIAAIVGVIIVAVAWSLITFVVVKFIH